MKRGTKDVPFNDFQYVYKLICLNRESICFQRAVSNRYVCWSYSMFLGQWVTSRKAAGSIPDSLVENFR